MRIPSKNLFYILCYAWERLGRLRAAPTETGRARHELPQNLLARILCEEVARVLRRGLDRDYGDREEDTRRPRGKPDLATTVQRALRRRGQVRVRYRELSSDVLHNRIVRTTMLRLATVDGLERKTKEELARLVRRFGDVGEVYLREETFRQVQIHRNNADYGFLLDLCRLIARLMVPDRTGTGAVRFRDFTTEQEAEWGHLFEGFVRGFLRIEHPYLRVWNGHKIITWASSKPAPGRRLQSMETDIFVPSGGGRSIILETKCVKQPFERDGLRNDHLFQLFAYLRNHAGSNPAELPALGVLLYATDGRPFDTLRYDLHGHPVQVRFVDLGRPWPSVVENLNDLAAELAEKRRRGPVRAGFPGEGRH